MSATGNWNLKHLEIKRLAFRHQCFLKRWFWYFGNVKDSILSCSLLTQSMQIMLYTKKEVMQIGGLPCCPGSDKKLSGRKKHTGPKSSRYSWLEEPPTARTSVSRKQQGSREGACSTRIVLCLCQGAVAGEEKPFLSHQKTWIFF